MITVLHPVREIPDLVLVPLGQLRYDEVDLGDVGGLYQVLPAVRARGGDGHHGVEAQARVRGARELALVDDLGLAEAQGLGHVAQVVDAEVEGDLQRLAGDEQAAIVEEDEVEKGT